MQIITSIAQIRQIIYDLKCKNNKINFVPTMGYLHDGHKQLINEARINCDILVVSIFVNPLQFGQNEDLDNYPQNLNQDIRLCEENMVDILFTPNRNELIGNASLLSSVKIEMLDKYLCGASRLGHFTGVCTIVSKLFNLIQPNKAYLGKKDIQQFRIIQQMVLDLNFPVQIIGVNTVRDYDGLALSSRNSYLSNDERSAAKIVPQTLNFVKTQLKLGNLNCDIILKEAKQKIDNIPIARLDYLEVVDYQNLQITNNFNQPVIIAAAIFIGKTRLIDNQILDLTKT